MIVGHPGIASPRFIRCTDQSDAQATPVGSILLYDFTATSAVHYAALIGDRLPLAFTVKTLGDALIASRLGASYLIVPSAIAVACQQAADAYLFDTKILLLIDEEREIVWAATRRIDGVIFRSALV